MSPRLTLLLVLCAGLALAGLSRLPGRGSVAAALDADGRGAFTEAADLLHDAGGSSPSVTALHDAGVVAHHAGDVPRALAVWRRAQLLSPRDPDLAHNLALTRTGLDADVPPPVDAPRRWMAVVSPAELGLVALGLWVATSALSVVAWRRAAPDGRRLRVGLGVIAALVSVPAIDGACALNTSPVAVVTSVAVVREAPDDSAPEEHSLPAGTEVRVVDQAGPFVRVLDGRARTGWVLASLLAGW